MRLVVLQVLCTRLLLRHITWWWSFFNLFYFTDEMISQKYMTTAICQNIILSRSLWVFIHFSLKWSFPWVHFCHCRCTFGYSDVHLWPNVSRHPSLSTYFWPGLLYQHINVPVSHVGVIGVRILPFPWRKHFKTIQKLL